MRKIVVAALLLVAGPAGAAVWNEESRTEATAGGGTELPFDFPVADVSHLEVFVGGVKLESGWRAVINFDQIGSPGGKVIFDVPPVVGAKIRVQRTVPLTQPMVLNPYSAFPAKSLERTLDHLTFGLQQLQRRLNEVDPEVGGGYLTGGLADSIYLRLDGANLMSELIARHGLTVNGQFRIDGGGFSCSGDNCPLPASLAVAKTELPDFGDFVLSSALPSLLSPYALKTELPDLSTYALKAELPDFSTFALKSALNDQWAAAVSTFFPKAEIASYALAADVAAVYATKAALGAYALKTELPDLSTYALKAELPDLTPYAKTADVAATYATKAALGAYALKTELPDLSPYVLKEEAVLKSGGTVDGTLVVRDLEVRGYRGRTVLVKDDESYYADTETHTIFCEAVESEVKVILPAAKDVPGMEILVVKVNNGERCVLEHVDGNIWNPEGWDLGINTQAWLTIRGVSCRMVAGGNDWWIVGGDGCTIPPM